MHDALQSQISYTPLGKGGGKGGKPKGSRLSEQDPAHHLSNQGKGNYVWVPNQFQRQTFGKLKKGRDQSLDNLSHAGSQQSTQTPKRGRFSEAAIASRHARANAGANGSVEPSTSTPSPSPLTTSLYDQLKSAQLSLQSIAGRNDPTAQFMRTALNDQSKTLQHSITQNKPPSERIPVLEDFISRKEMAVEATLQLIANSQAKLVSLQKEIEEANEQLVEAQSAVAKPEDAIPVTIVPVDPLLEVGKLTTLLPPDLAASFAEGLRQLNLLQAHATKQPAAAMEVTTLPAEEKKENPVPLASLLLSSSFAARPSGSPSPTRGLRKSRSLSPEGGKSRSRSKDRGPLIPLEEPPLGTEATHGNG
jgi:hypothetical protein